MKMKFGFNQFCKTVYDVSPESYLDFDTYYFDFDWMSVSEEEINNVIKHFNLLNEDYIREELKDVIYRVKCSTYEKTYMEEYYQKVIQVLTEKIREDFDEMFDLIQPCFTHDQADINNMEPLSIDFNIKDDQIIIEGDLDLFEEMIIAAINGYGMFYYEDLEDFRYVCEGYTPKERIEGHLHWLKYVSDIWGTYTFTVDLEGYDRYIFGDETDYTMEDIEEEVIWHRSDVDSIRELYAQKGDIYEQETTNI